jgi:dimethylhistidine N-methyltransferase
MTAPEAARDEPSLPSSRRATGAAPLLRDVLACLRARPKTLPSGLFYDARGARLFEQITALDEYYPTRTEIATLGERAGEIAEVAGPECTLIEYGSGAGIKARILLDALREPAAYIPIDVSAEQLARVSREMIAAYPEVAVLPVNADYSLPFTLPELPYRGCRLAFFPGSTIGNLRPAAAAALLGQIRAVCGPGGALVLGVDRTKDPDVLHAAYNDRAGITAQFNLNILTRLNRELGADFDVSRFRHLAFYNPAESRVEMHLESLDDQVVRVRGEEIAFATGETIWTESSYKYDEPQLRRIIGPSGFTIHRLWSDAGERFWVALLRAPHAVPADQGRR